MESRTSGCAQNFAARKIKTAQSFRVPPFLLSAVTAEVETGADGEVRVSLADLRRVTDQVERILSAKGVPTPTKIIVSELNREMANRGVIRTVKNVAAAMSDDDRFRPIGRTGVWALKRWRVETRTIVDVAADIIRRKKRPVTEAELSTLIQAKRSVSYESLGSLLGKDSRFTRIRARTWELKTIS